MTDELIADIEESGEELEQDVSSPWLGAHKQVVFSAIDYSLKDLAEQAVAGELDLQPGYQRRLRWSDERKSRLIESFLMNVPVPPVFLSEEADGIYAVIDGKQRILALADFVLGGMPLRGLKFYADLNGLRFDDLPKKDKDFLSKRIPLRAIIVLEQSPKEIKFETFKRLNTGGVQLNAQEIRNIAYRGPLNDLVMELSENSDFHRMLRIRDKSKSTMYQHMRDAELVLRFLAFRTNWRQFSGSIKGHMDSFMEDKRRMPPNEIDDLRAEFGRVLEVVDVAFGDYAYRRWQPVRGQWRQQVVAAIYDAQMLGCQGLTAERLEGRRDDVLEGLKKLFATKRFQDATEAATNAKVAFAYRIRSIERLLKRVAR